MSEHNENRKTGAVKKQRALNRSERAFLKRIREERGGWVPLPELARASSTRSIRELVHDLRGFGYEIHNRLKRDTPNGLTHSWYRLVSEPEEPGTKDERPETKDQGLTNSPQT